MRKTETQKSCTGEGCGEEEDLKLVSLQRKGVQKQGFQDPWERAEQKEMVNVLHPVSCPTEVTFGVKISTEIHLAFCSLLVYKLL